MQTAVTETQSITATTTKLRTTDDVQLLNFSRSTCCLRPQLHEELLTLSGCRLAYHCRQEQDCHGDVMIRQFGLRYPSAYDRNEPLVDDELHDFDRVREGVREADFMCFIFLLISLCLQPFQPPGRHVRHRVELSFPGHQELDHSADLAQVLGPVHDSLLLCCGLEV